MAKGRTETAIGLLREIVAAYPSFADAHLRLAELLATYPVARFRDGQAALCHAQEPCRLVSMPKLSHLNALAAAYAEAQQFEHAVEMARLALEKGAKLKRDLQPLQMRLDLYSSGKPYRSHAMVSTNPSY